MKTMKVLIGVASVVAMLLFVQPVRADVLYDSAVALADPILVWNKTTGGDGIAAGTGGQYAADKFTLSFASTITSIELGLRNGDHSSSPNQVFYEILPTGTGTALYFGTVALTSIEDTANGGNLDRFQSVFTLTNVNLAAGDYYLKLSNAVASGTGQGILWGYNTSSSINHAWSGSDPNDTNSFRTLGPNAPENSFIINGTPTGSSQVPEPTTMVLLGLGLFGLGGFRKRLLKK